MTSIIHVAALEKTYKHYKNHKGFFGAFRNLFDRRFDLIHAVDKISFDIKPGELVGYIGPNGAGKSTTIKMLTDLLVPTAGDVIVNGCVPWKDRKKYVKDIGAVFGQRTSLWWNLPVRDSLDLLKYIYEIPDEQFDKNIKQFQEILDLSSFMDIPVRSLSLGQRMRADLSTALLHDPKIIFWMNLQSAWMSSLNNVSVILFGISIESIRQPSCSQHMICQTSLNYAKGF